MALITTPGSASATSYCSEAEAEQYHEAHVSGLAWIDPATSALEDLKEPALIQASRMLDALFDWTGVVASQTQALGWPRYEAYDRQDRLISATEIPQAIKDATAELARQLLTEDRGADSEIETQGIKAVKAGSVEVQFDSTRATAKPIPDAVFHLIGNLGTLRSRGFNTIKLVRG